MDEPRPLNLAEDCGPTKIIYSVGKNAYGQPIKLSRHRDTSGRVVWTLEREQATQLDDTARISGLSTEDILAMATIVHGNTFYPR